MRATVALRETVMVGGSAGVEPAQNLDNRHLDLGQHVALLVLYLLELVLYLLDRREPGLYVLHFAADIDQRGGVVPLGLLHRLNASVDVEDGARDGPQIFLSAVDATDELVGRGHAGQRSASRRHRQHYLFPPGCLGSSGDTWDLVLILDRRASRKV